MRKKILLACNSASSRILSIAIPVAYVILAILRIATAASSAEGAAALIGAQERTMAYSFRAWVIALAIHLQLLAGSIGG